MSVMSFATPPFADQEGVARVVAALGGEPAGLLARFVIKYEDGIRVVGVWESLEHGQRFQRDQLGPALARAMGEPTGTPRLDWYDVLSTYIATPVAAG